VICESCEKNIQGQVQYIVGGKAYCCQDHAPVAVVVETEPEPEPEEADTCEGCPNPATVQDDHGTPLCDECLDESLVPDEDNDGLDSDGDGLDEDGLDEPALDNPVPEDEEPEPEGD